MKKIVMIILVISFLAVLSGCNTMGGLGKDIQKAGEALENAAD